MHPLLRANRNTVWAAVMVESLVRCGVTRAVISPGSRSTPLTLAFALDGRVATTPVLDERSAAFFALGQAKAAGEPVALVCTSGTAAANYLPALVEARHSGVPLIALTADRPPELRECAAGQTIDQTKLFGEQVNFFHELPLPPLERRLGERHAALARVMVHAVATATVLQPGPVHVNVPFREPLAPVDDEPGGPFPALDLQRLPVPLSPTWSPGAAGDLPWVGQGGVLVVAGPPEVPWTDEDRAAIACLCTANGWPLLADTASGLRGWAGEGAALVGHYDSILRDPARRRELAPGALLFFGQLPTSKILRAFLREHARVPAWRVGRNPLDANALNLPVTLVPARPAALMSEKDLPPAEPTPLAARWLMAEAAEKRRLAKGLRAAPGLFEGRWPAVLAGALPVQATVFVASSMPIRDAEFFWPINRKRHVIVVNRGANGIDGTLSAALGMAEAAGRPAALVTGDLAFLYDTNGLLLAQEFTGSLSVFVLNNHGGGIFENLPIADFEPPFERFFATPQAVDFKKLAVAYGIEYRAPTNWDEVAALAKKLPRRGVRLIEIKTDRRRDPALRRAILNGE